MVPMMKRQQHDEASKQLYAQLGELDKVDPLDVHYNEAQKIKADLTKRINSQASKLATEGFNTSTTGDIYKTNNDIKEQYSPTGRLGKINAAKKEYAEQFKEYIEDATKNKGFSREDALYNWQVNHAPKYTGYNENKEITNITPYGAPKRLILQDDLKTVKSLLGETGMTVMKNNNWHFAPGPNGSLVTVDGSGRVVDTNNYSQLKSASEYLASRWINPTGEGSISAKFERQDPKRIVNEINSGLQIMTSRKVDDTRDDSHSIVGYENSSKYNKDKSDQGSEAVNLGSGVSVTKNQDLLSRLKGGSGGLTTKTKSETDKDGGGLTPFKLDRSNVNQVVNSEDYISLATKLKRTNYIPKNVDIKSQKAQEAVTKYLSENKDATIQNKYLDQNSNSSAGLFASKNVPKDKKAASQNLLDRVITGASEMRTEDGKVVNKDDIKGFSYLGDMSFDSKIGNVFPSDKQNTLAHRGYYIDSNNKKHNVYISRNSDDFNTPEFNSAYTLGKALESPHSQPGIYHPMKDSWFKDYGMKNVEIKKNKNSGTFDVSYTQIDPSTGEEKSSNDLQFKSSEQLGEFLLMKKMQ